MYRKGGNVRATLLARTLLLLTAISLVKTIPECSLYDGTLFSAEDKVEAVDIARLNEKWKKSQESIVSLDCEFRLLWYIGAPRIIELGGHMMTPEKANSFARQAIQEWSDNPDPNAVHTLSEDLGVTPDYLDQMWSNGRIVWEFGKLRNTLTPYSESGNPIDAAFDGTAEWMYLINSKQVTVFERTMKMGHFGIHTLRQTPAIPLDFKVVKETENTVQLEFPSDRKDVTAESVRTEFEVDKKSGSILSNREIDGEMVTSHYEGALTEIQPGIWFPQAVVNLVCSNNKVINGQFFFLTKISINKKIDDSVYGLAVPARTQLIYAGDLAANEVASNRESHVQMKVTTPLPDVRSQLPELRRLSAAKRARLADSQTLRITGEQPRERSPFLPILVAANLLLAVGVVTIWFAKRRKR
jgi:hypothetical protein